MDGPGGRGRKAAKRTAKTDGALTVLVVDDIETNRKLLRVQLISVGHRVLEASDGAAAMVMLRKRKVDVIISDILMPRMDGYQFCLKVRGLRRFDAVPFLFCSGTYASSEDAKLARSVGADALIPKPVVLKDLLKAIRAARSREKPRLSRRVSSALLSRKYSERLTLKLEQRNAELEQKQAELASREELLRALIETAAELIILTDRNQRILTANAAALEVTGRSLEALQSMSVVELIPASYRPMWRERITTLSPAADHVHYVELPIDTASGRRRWIGVNVRQRTVDGASVGLYLIARDITELRLAQQALRESEARYRLLFDANPLPMWVFDLETLRFLAVNDTAIRFYGYSREDFLAMTIVDIRPLEEVRSLHRWLARDRSEIGTLGMARHRRKDGSMLTVELTGHDISFDGRRARLILADDVTERLSMQEELSARERRLTSFFSGSTAGLAIWDADLRYAMVNETLADINGWSVAEHLGKPIETILPELAPVLSPILRSVLESGVPQLNIDVTGPTRKAPGVIRYWNASYFPIRGRDHRIEGVGGIIVETTAWKEAAEALAASEAELRALFSSMDDIVIVLDAEGRYLQIAPTNPVRLKLPVGQLLGKTVAEVMSPLEARPIMAAVGDALKFQETRRVEYMLTLNGNEVWFEGSVSPISHSSVIWVARDITERRRERLAMEEMHRQLKYLFDTLDEAFYSVDLVHNRTLQISPAMERIFGRPIADFYDNPVQWYDMVLPEDRSAVDEKLLELKSGESTLVQFRIRRPDSAVRWIESIIKPTLGDDGVVARVDGVCFDVTERRWAEERLQEQAALLDQAGESISVRDLNGKIIYWNKGSERLYGYTASEAIGHNVFDLLKFQPTSEFETAQQRVLEDGDWVGELHQQHRNGTPVVVESHWTLVRDDAGQPRAVFVINSDITDRRRLQAELSHALKMESLGTLAGGIAHDFNNILGIIIAHGSLMESYVGDPEKVVSSARRIMTAADRGAALVRQLLTFARKSEVSLDQVDLNPIVDEVVQLLRHTLPRTIQIDTATRPGLPKFLGDANQLHQVIVNLGVNSRDAMPRGGQLMISTDLVKHAAIKAVHPDAAEGEYVQLRISDTGIGMDEKTRVRIFEPFFTTKEMGKGTGLGLSTVFGIVRGHHGHIDVHSEVGVGTAFTISFPVPGSQTTHKADRSQAQTAPVRGTETILVVEDEDDLRSVARDALVKNGYTVHLASDGGEGIATFADHRSAVELIVTDLGLPNVDGRSMIRMLRETGCHIPIVVTSGHVEPEVRLELEELDVARIVPKPFTAEELLRAIREVFDRTAP